MLQPNGENKSSSSEAAIVQFGLNQSQGNVVASCISATEHSSSSVRLVWGPPGTGKTKTVSVILYFLLKMAKKPRVLVCGPTNIALGRLTQGGPRGPRDPPKVSPHEKSKVQSIRGR